VERDTRYGGCQDVLPFCQIGHWHHRVTTDGHDSRAIRTELGEAVRHRTNRYLNNRIEQGHRGIKGLN
jgi:transposase-like protein